MFGHIGAPRKYGVYVDNRGNDIHIVAVTPDTVTYRVGYVVRSITKSYWKCWSEDCGFTQCLLGVSVRSK